MGEFKSEMKSEIFKAPQSLMAQGVSGFPFSKLEPLIGEYSPLFSEDYCLHADVLLDSLWCQPQAYLNIECFLLCATTPNQHDTI